VTRLETKRFLRFLVGTAALLYVTPSAHTWLWILYRSPYHADVNWWRAGSEILLVNAASGLPIFALMLLLFVVFETSSAHDDVAVIVDYHNAHNRPGAAASEIDARKVEIAVKRIGLIVGVVTALVGLGTWMQDSVTKRAAVTQELEGQMGNAAVREGRRLLRASVTAKHDSATCIVCADLRRYFRGDAASTAAESTRVADEVTTLNAIESILHFRRSGALSELEFHSLWAKVVSEVLGEVSVHVQGDAELRVKIDSYLPMLRQQMAARGSPS
jgi:hypothetical protein